MSKKRYTIKPLQGTGRKMPFVLLITLWLFLDRLRIPEWGWGIYYTFCALLIIFFIYDLVSYDETFVDIQKLLKKHYEETGQDKKEETI